MQMTVQWDDRNQVQAIYFKVTSKKVHRTKEIHKDVLVDLDSAGEVVGLELLSLEPHVRDFLDCFTEPCEIPVLDSSRLQQFEEAVLI